jgi:hypothetical protein
VKGQLELMLVMHQRLGYLLVAVVLECALELVLALGQGLKSVLVWR